MTEYGIDTIVFVDTKHGMPVSDKEPEVEKKVIHIAQSIKVAQEVWKESITGKVEEITLKEVLMFASTHDRLLTLMGNKNFVAAMIDYIPKKKFHYAFCIG